MEGMEIDPSPPALVPVGGGGLLRRSNSAPLLPGATGTPPPEKVPPRMRRCSVSLEGSGLGGEATMETLPRDVRPPNARTPTPPRRAPAPPASALEKLKRKGELDPDSPPRKLFVAGTPLMPPAL